MIQNGIKVKRHRRKNVKIIVEAFRECYSKGLTSENDIMEPLENYLRFIREAELLKSTLRTAWTAAGRQESTAEHSWRLALFAGVLAPSFPALDLRRVLMMCLIHDLGELYTGDVSAALEPDAAEKYEEEHQAARRIFSLLPESQAAELLQLWREYGAGETPEARFVKALDKAETIIQHNQGSNPPEFDYEFNLGYGKKYFRDDPLLAQLREAIDAETRARLAAEA